MPETITIGYVDAGDLEIIDRIVDSVLQRERIFYDEEDNFDLFVRNVRNHRRRSMRYERGNL